MIKPVVYVPTSEYPPLKQGGTIKNPEFQPSYYEWLSIKGQQINIFNSVGAGTLTLIYTVPDGYDLYITFAQLSALRALEGFYNSEIYINAAASGGRLLELTAGKFNDATGFAQIGMNVLSNFTTPIKIQSGQLLYLNTNLAVYSNIWGFLVKKADISLF